jgi:hypothetical protein
MDLENEIMDETDQVELELEPTKYELLAEQAGY